MQVIPEAALAQHGPESKEPWVVVNGAVYDVSKFAKLHPGGQLVLLRACGKDASKDFNAVHHPSVLDKYNKLKIGEMEGGILHKNRSKPKKEPRSTVYTDHYWLTSTFVPPPYYTKQHFDYLKKIRAFYEKEIIPFAGKWDEERGYPAELHRKSYEAGLYGAMWPAEYGGTPPPGWDAFMAFISYYEAARVPSGGVQASFASMTIALPPILKHGSHELKSKYGRPIIEGTAVSSLCITEPWAGSDVTQIRTTARKEGDVYIVNGEKKFITNGVKAHILTVAVRTAPPQPKNPFFGVSLLVIEANSPGVDRRRMNTQGWWGSNTAYITFENVKVPTANLIGEEHQGFKYIMSNFNTERFMMCVSAAASCHKVISESIRYAKVRKTFGQSLMEHQAIRHKLAEMSIRTEALYAMCEQVTYMMHVKAPDLDIGARIALLKVHATKTFEFVCREASQIFGGASYQRAGGQGEIVERYYRDVRVNAIGGGSEEILMDLGIRMSKL